MRKPVPAEQFAEQMNSSVERIEEFAGAGLLDLDQDGLFDDFDVLRLSLLCLFEGEADSVEQIKAELEKADHEKVTQRIFMLGRKVWTRDEAAAELGITVEQADQLSAALGIAPSLQLDETDLDALRVALRFMDLGIPWEGLLEGARVYGDSFRRIAQAEVSLAHRYFCEQMAAQGASDDEISLRFYEVGPLLTELSQGILQHIHEDFLLRALIDHALVHFEAGSSTGLPGSMETTILFVDLALFTPLAQAHGDEIAAEILDRFGEIVRRRAIEHGGSVVKQIGDGFMLTFGQPVDAVRYAMTLLADAGLERNFPALRVGIHAGRVLYRVGDYVGNAVNIAARVVGMAMPNVILMTEAVARAARENGIDVEELGVRSARGVEEPLVIYRVASPAPATQDPVCGMVVGDDAAGRVVHDGVDYAFCSQDCLRSFLENPDRYVGTLRAQA